MYVRTCAPRMTCREIPVPRWHLRSNVFGITSRELLTSVYRGIVLVLFTPHVMIWSSKRHHVHPAALVVLCSTVCNVTGCVASPTDTLRCSGSLFCGIAWHLLLGVVLVCASVYRGIVLHPLCAVEHIPSCMLLASVYRGIVFLVLYDAEHTTTPAVVSVS